MSLKETLSACFDTRLKNKARDEFKLLLCDVETCDSHQLELLTKLLDYQKDDEPYGHTNIINWVRYISCTSDLFPERKLYLQRLVNKAFEFFDESSYKLDKSYLCLHIYSAEFKNDAAASLRYVENTIVKRKIGISLSLLYFAWIKYTIIANKSSSEGILRAKEILRKGIENMNNITTSADGDVMMKEDLSLMEKTLKKVNGVTSDSDAVDFLVDTVEGQIKAITGGVQNESASDTESTIFSINSEKISKMMRSHTDEYKRYSTTEETSSRYQSNDSSFSSNPRTSSSNSGNTSNNATRRSSTMSTSSTSSSYSLSNNSSTSSNSGSSDLDKENDRDAINAKYSSNSSGVKDKDMVGSKSRKYSSALTSKSNTKRPLTKTNLLGNLPIGKCQRVMKEKDDLDESLESESAHSNIMDNTTASFTQNKTNNDNNTDVSFADSTRELDTVRLSTTGKNSHKNQMNISIEAITMKTKSTSESHNTSGSKRSKPNLSKYVDDNLLNFNPYASRSAFGKNRNDKKSSSSSSSKSESVSSNSKMVHGDVDEKTVDSSRGGNKAFNDYNNMNGSNYDNGNEKRGVTFQEREDHNASHSNAVVSVATKSTAVTTKSSDLVGIGGAFNQSFVYININEKTYLRFAVLGKGGSSCVYSILSEDGKTYAYKKVNVHASSSEPEALFESYCNEIDLLNRLKNSPYIIQLVDTEIDRTNLTMAMVMEAGEVDLSKVLKNRQGNSNAVLSTASNSEASITTRSLSKFFLRMIWQEMLEAVDFIHDNRVVHGDLKPANFVFVKGHLKLIDFGIAKAFSNDTTNIYRDSQIGTINYMAPEAIAPRSDITSDNGAKLRLGRASDIWSLGCILYQLIYGQPPFASLKTIQKLTSIPNPNYIIHYPDNTNIAFSDLSQDKDIPDAIESMKCCLHRDPSMRAPIKGETGLLSMKFLS
jgi:hypothetical protein